MQPRYFWTGEYFLDLGDGAFAYGHVLWLYIRAVRNIAAADLRSKAPKAEGFGFNGRHVTVEELFHDFPGLASATKG
jgi:hypothetical protein